MWQYFSSELGNAWLFENNLFKLGNVMLMAFLFAPGIPIMFPFALLYVTINLLGTRHYLAYQCRKPFNYSNDMNVSLIKLLNFMPILYASFGIWMYSNRQIYDNAVLKKSKINGLQDHSHTIVYTLTTFTPATPLIVLLVIATINFFMVSTNRKYHKVFGGLT